MVNRVNGNDYYDYSKLKMPDASDKTGNGEKFSLNYQRADKGDEDKKEQAEEGKEGKEVRTSGSGGQRSVMQGGVRLELSGNARTIQDKNHDGSARAQVFGRGIFDTVRSWISAFAQSVRTFLYQIWNDDTAQNARAEENGGGQDPDGVQGAGAVRDAGTVEGAESVLDAGTVEGMGFVRNPGTPESTERPERLTEEYLELQKLEDLRNPGAAAKRQLQREADREKEIQRYLKSGNLEQVLNLVTQNGRKTMAKNSTLLTYYDRTGKIAPLSASDQERILHGDRNVKKL